LSDPGRVGEARLGLGPRRHPRSMERGRHSLECSRVRLDDDFVIDSVVDDTTGSARSSLAPSENQATMSLHRSLAFATLAVLGLSTPAFAADSTGSTGTIESVEINETSADTYLQYHGRLVVNASGKLTEYRWGGTSCSNKTLSTSLVGLLWEAFYQRDRANISPRFQAGQGTNKCLVGFTLSPVVVAPTVQ
jgi:hypothetical protein